VHRETLIIWGLGETSDAWLAEEHRHGAGLALDRLGHHLRLDTTGVANDVDESLG